MKVPSPYTFDQLAACAERELRFRRRVYARRVQLQKMTQELADREIALMEAIHTHLAHLAGQAAYQAELFARGA